MKQTRDEIGSGFAPKIEKYRKEEEAKAIAKKAAEDAAAEAAAEAALDAKIKAGTQKDLTIVQNKELLANLYDEYPEIFATELSSIKTPDPF